MQYIKVLKTNFYFVFIILWVCTETLFAHPLAIVIQGINVKPYNKVLEGIKKSCNAKIEKIVLYEYKGDLNSYIRKKNPDLLFAIGRWAFSELSYIEDIPIIYLMVLNPSPSLKKRKNIAGIDMLISAKKSIFYIKKYIPKTKCIGTIYNPAHSKSIIEELSNSVKEFHMCLMTKKANSVKDVIHAINEIADKIDVFLMIPDITVLTPETVRFMSIFFLKKMIPIVTFSKKYLDMGALMAIYADPYDMGVQAGNLANQILQKKVKLPIQLRPKKEIVMINSYVAKNLGLDIKINNKGGE